MTTPRAKMAARHATLLSPFTSVLLLFLCLASYSTSASIPASRPGTLNASSRPYSNAPYSDAESVGDETMSTESSGTLSSMSSTDDSWQQPVFPQCAPRPFGEAPIMTSSDCPTAVTRLLSTLLLAMDRGNYYLCPEHITQQIQHSWPLPISGTSPTCYVLLDHARSHLRMDSNQTVPLTAAERSDPYAAGCVDIEYQRVQRILDMLVSTCKDPQEYTGGWVTDRSLVAEFYEVRDDGAPMTLAQAKNLTLGQHEEGDSLDTDAMSESALDR